MSFIDTLREEVSFLASIMEACEKAAIISAPTEIYLTVSPKENPEVETVLRIWVERVEGTDPTEIPLC